MFGILAVQHLDLRKWNQAYRQSKDTLKEKDAHLLSKRCASVE